MVRIFGCLQRRSHQICWRIKSGEDARRLQGIGKRIAGKIDELLASGHISKLDEIRGDEVNKAVSELSQVSGVGMTNCLLKILKISLVEVGICEK